ncbi:ATP dependent DNA ligase-like protein,ATP dependent DNA ligase family protein [Actinobacteria bacterium IMCC26207]|nr:ATP dependent DNA ligase-like protein,ATP dependent DNA ligase family protein [Actinobacteria bacterium IMCC26207]
MLAKASKGLPVGDFLYEPKWDGLRCLVFRDGTTIELLGRNEQSLTEFFPDLVASLLEQLPQKCVLDGELLVAADGRLDFDLLSQRLQSNAAQVEQLAQSAHASLMVFDLLALADQDLRSEPLADRRKLLLDCCADLRAPLHLTPATVDAVIAQDWYDRFRGSGFDGVMAKALEGTYVEDKRTQIKVKHHQTADCVVAGYRVHPEGGVASLLLGLYEDNPSASSAPNLQPVGLCSGFSASQRRTLAAELTEYEEGGHALHPWPDLTKAVLHSGPQEMEGRNKIWAAAISGEWVPLRCELVVELTYENFTSERFRQAARFVRWRPDKSPTECRFDQVDHPAPAEYQTLFPEA